jgi:hypothetical protein
MGWLIALGYHGRQLYVRETCASAIGAAASAAFLVPQLSDVTGEFVYRDGCGTW